MATHRDNFPIEPGTHVGECWGCTELNQVLRDADGLCEECGNDNTSAPKYLDGRIAGAVSDAEAIFWEGLKPYFPEAKTATLDPTTVMVLSVAMENAVRDWVWLNVTKEGA